MKKNVALITCGLIFAASLCFQSRLVQAGGIPVIDSANLAEQLKQYLQDLKDFQEMLDQGTTMTKQYIQMVYNYHQVLREYQHYLRQLKGIKHMISAKEWRNLMRIIKYYRGKSKRSVVTAMDPYDPNYEDDLNTVLGSYGHVPRDPVDVAADAQMLGIWSYQYRREVNQDYEKYELYKDRLRMVSDNENKIEELRELIQIHQDNINNLGDESDLATLQENNLQNVTIMKQNDSMLKTLNQVLLNMESEVAEKAARRAKAREAELIRLKNRQPTQRLGRDRWGSF